MELKKNSNSMLNGLPLTPKDNKKIGPIVGVLVIVLVIIVAALYFFSQRLNTTTAEIKNEVSDSSVVTNSGTTTGLETSNEAAAIEADLDKQLLDIDYSF